MLYDSDTRDSKKRNGNRQKELVLYFGKPVYVVVAVSYILLNLLYI